MKTPYCALLVALAAWRADGAASAYHLWDGQESVAGYARRAGLEPTKTIDLGNGVTMEFVLIPAGKFIRGTPVPAKLDTEGMRQKVILGENLVIASAGAVMVMLAMVAIRGIQSRRPPQYSLAQFIMMVLFAGVGVCGGTNWYEWEGQETEHWAAMARLKEAEDDEKPAREITISAPFYMGKFEVTQEQYQAVTGMSQSHFNSPRNPVESVRWDDAQGFCWKLSGATRRMARLPSEAEWEYACRAGTRTSFSSGDAKAHLDAVAWHCANSTQTTHPVGLKQPNAWGLYDMHGNVWEWCQDGYDPHYYESSPAMDPPGDPEVPHRVRRGGSWHCYGRASCRSASRSWSPQFGSYPDLGFRVALSIAPKAP